MTAAGRYEKMSMHTDFKPSSYVPIVNIVSYSYKGGSGRSTATVNIAFKLAHMGKLVVCLDMDVGAAGLHMILGEWDPRAKEKIYKSNGEIIGHQNFLNRDRADFTVALQELDEAVLNLGADERFSTLFPVENAKGQAHPRGGLLFLFSSTRERALKDLSGGPEGEKHFEKKYLALQQALARSVGGSSEREVYVLVDAPNGITSVSLPLLTSSDLILMFYRHSLQHIRGTIEAGERLHHYLSEEVDRRFMRVLLVGSCVPEHIIDGLNIARAKGRVDLVHSARQMLEKFGGMASDLERFERGFSKLVEHLDHKIIEDDVLKVLEQPLTDDGVRKDLLGYKGAEGREYSSKRTREKIERISETITDYGTRIRKLKNRRYGIMSDAVG
jgi:hypothetical protein